MPLYGLCFDLYQEPNKVQTMLIQKTELVADHTRGHGRDAPEHFPRLQAAQS